MSIIQGVNDNPKPVEEVAREDTIMENIDMPSVSPVLSLRLPDHDDFDGLRLYGATSGIPLVVSDNGSNMVYTILPPPQNIVYSKEVIEKA